MGWLRERRDARLREVFEPVLRELIAEKMFEAGRWKTPDGYEMAQGLKCQVDGLPLFVYDRDNDVTTCKNGHRWTGQHEAQGFT